MIFTSSYLFYSTRNPTEAYGDSGYRGGGHDKKLKRQELTEKIDKF